MTAIKTYLKNPRVVSAAISWLAVILFFVLKYFHIDSLYLILIQLAGIIIGGHLFALEGWEKLLKKNISIDLLMSVGIAGAAILGEWQEALLLTALYATSEAIESYTKDKTRTAIRALMDLAPKKALVRRDNKETIIPAEEIRLGDLFIVKPGESIATDGVIKKGSASINQAAITGESVPVFKQTGEQVFAGTINEDGIVEIEATKTNQENTLAKIIHLVEEAQKEKSRQQQVVEKFGKVYSPFVLLVAFGIGIVPVLFGQSVSVWFERAIIFIIGAEPAVLAISVPLAFAAAIGSAGKRGVLIKGGVYLEELAAAKVIAFDKTGTLTLGKPKVTNIVPLDGHTHQEILKIAGSLSLHSTHPLGYAFREHALQEGVTPQSPQNFQSITGSGVKGDIDGQTFYFCSYSFFKNLGHADVESDTFKKLSSEGNTVTFVGTEKEIYGLVAIADVVRPEAKEMLDRLTHLGVKSIMLTGDNYLVAQSIGRELGVTEVFADLKPSDKVHKIKELKEKYRHAAMVGDGVNDAPALAESSVGLAMGTAGTDAALEAANVALLGDDLSKIPYAVRLARFTKSIVMQNLVFSIGLLSATIILAVFAITPMSVLLLIHEGGEVLVIANGLRLLKGRV